MDSSPTQSPGKLASKSKLKEIDAEFKTALETAFNDINCEIIEEDRRFKETNTKPNGEISSYWFGADAKKLWNRLKEALSDKRIEYYDILKIKLLIEADPETWKDKLPKRSQSFHTSSTPKKDAGAASPSLHEAITVKEELVRSKRELQAALLSKDQQSLELQEKTLELERLRLELKESKQKNKKLEKEKDRALKKTKRLEDEISKIKETISGAATREIPSMPQNINFGSMLIGYLLAIIVGLISFIVYKLM